jgi:glycosyltransferase involved in cell wall biosynthesis
MACGLPVVGFATGGICDTVRDGQTGYLVRPRDAAGLAAALEALLSDNPRRHHFGQASRAVAVAEYSVALQVERYESLYVAVATSRRGHHSC